MRAIMKEQVVQLPGGELEYAVLFTVCELGAASARDVYLHVGKAHGLAYTTIATVLDRLHAKGLVTSWNGEATPERGGRAKRYFKLTAEGERALRASRTAWARMWDGLSFGTVPG